MVLRDCIKRFWEAVLELRGHADIVEFKNLILTLIFLKSISAEAPIQCSDGENLGALLSAQTQRNGSDPGERLNSAVKVLKQINPQLENVVDLDFSRISIGNKALVELLSLIEFFTSNAEMPLRASLIALYTHCLEQFATLEGKTGAEYLTPPSIAELIVELAPPTGGIVYDPVCGSGGLLIKSHEHFSKHKVAGSTIDLHGCESNLCAWRSCRMNMLIHGVDANLSGQPLDSLRDNPHWGLRADCIVANPPFNIGRWAPEGRISENDPRWRFGAPPAGNSNFAWIQHIIFHLKPTGTAAFLMSNSALSSTTCGEGDIRKRLVESDLIDCIIALPKDLFYTTRIAASLWIVAGNKAATHPNRTQQVLFIDAQTMGQRTARTQKILAPRDIQRLSKTYHSWRYGRGKYANTVGFCRSVPIEDIAAPDFTLMPSRYVGNGASPAGAADEPGLKQLTGTLKKQFAESARLERTIRERLERIGYEI